MFGVEHLSCRPARQACGIGIGGAGVSIKAGGWARGVSWDARTVTRLGRHRHW
jgi:hypothetical protein